MKESTFVNTKKNKPISVVIHSTNVLGNNIAKTLAEQGSKVILVDQFNSESKKKLLELKKIGEVDFVDIKSLDNLIENIGHIDYIFYHQADFLLSNKLFESRDFLEESNNLNQCLKLTQAYNAKLTLITTIIFNEKLTHAIGNTNYSKPSPYSAEELQKYSETLIAEYHDKSKLNARILRIGAVLGEENNLKYYPEINQLFEDSVRNNSINIQGEGLDIKYVISLEDTIYGILKLTFSEETNGEVISLCNNNEYTMLSLAYKLLELNPEATEIKFVPETEKKPLIYTQYIPAPNAEEYNWKQKITLEESVSTTLKTKYNEFKKKWEKEINSESEYKKKLDEIRRQRTNKENTKGKIKENRSKIVKTPTGEAMYKIFKRKDEGKIEKKKKKKKQTPINIIWKICLPLIILILFYFLIYPLVSIGIGTYLIYNNGKTLNAQYADLEVDEIDKKLVNINSNIHRTSKSLEKLKWLFWGIQQSDLHQSTSLTLYGLENISQGAIELNLSAQPLLEYFTEFEPALDFQQGTPRTTREYTSILRAIGTNSPQIEEAINKITMGNNTLKQVDLEKFPKALNKYSNKIEEYILLIENQVSPLQKVTSFLPDVLGVDGRKRYLLLLQNPTELRSTGGWISSYAIIGIEGGQIRELNVDDVYNLDGELINKRKFFEAPKDMQDALEIEEWGLSLSNWDPNFQDTANNAALFVQEAGKAPSFDGVISIDVMFLQKLLSRWGGITIPGETELITSDNIHEKIFAMHHDFSPGESQKATFLANLANETLKRLFSSNPQEYAEILDVFVDSLHGKNILMFLKNNQAQAFLAEEGWDGAISPKKHSNTPFSIEWNWGANKSNLFLEREEKIQTEIVNADEIKYSYSLILKNNSSTNTYPQGDYKNYLRVYIPEGSNVDSVRGFQNNRYTTKEEKGFTVLGGWFNIPIETTREFTLQYTTKDTQNIFELAGDNIIMPVNVLKQPGTNNTDKIRLEIFYPEFWSIVEQDEFEKIGIQLSKTLILDSDKEFNLKWIYR